jgi:hypothetical protein
MLTQRQVLERQVERVKQTIERMETDAWRPLICLHTDNDKIAPIQLPDMPPTHELREALFAYLGEFAAEEIDDAEVVYLAVIAEAWSASVDKSEYESEDFVPPAERPDAEREEVVVFDVVAADGTVIGAVCPIIRDSRGNMHLGEPMWQQTEGDNVFESPMTERFFPVYHKAQLERRGAN